MLDEAIKLAIAEAVKDVEIATNQLNNCSEDFEEAAIFRLASAESKLNALIRRAKKMEEEMNEKVC